MTKPNTTVIPPTALPLDFNTQIRDQIHWAWAWDEAHAEQARREAVRPVEPRQVTIVVHVHPMAVVALVAALIGSRFIPRRTS